MKKNILAIIPARGGSKGIPRKNIKLLCGKPLIEYTALEARKSKYLNRIILSTDDFEIAEIGIALGLDVPFLRSKELSEDDSPSINVFKEVISNLNNLEKYSPDIIIILQPTSPFRTSNDIDKAIELFLENDVDSLVSVTEIPHNMSPSSALQLKGGLLEPILSYEETKNIRQLKPKYYARNGAAIYIFKLDCLLKKNSLFGDKTLPFYMNKLKSIDIDDQFDWDLTELIMQNLKKFL